MHGPHQFRCTSITNTLLSYLWLLTDELFVVLGDELEELLGGLDGGDDFLLLLWGHYDLNL